MEPIIRARTKFDYQQGQTMLEDFKIVTGGLKDPQETKLSSSIYWEKSKWVELPFTFPH